MAKPARLAVTRFASSCSASLVQADGRDIVGRRVLIEAGRYSSSNHELKGEMLWVEAVPPVIWPPCNRSSTR